MNLAGIPGRSRAAIAVALLVGLVVVVFAPTLRHGFVDLDDGLYVFENPEVRLGLCWRSVWWSFTTFRGGNWHPLTWLSLLVDTSLWGPGPFGHHLTNLVLHGASTLALFGLLASATGRMAPSLFVAALFGVHPLHVESVAWISERKDVLSGLAWMLALAAHQRFAARPGAGRYALVLVLFGLGLMAKPMVVTLPVVLFAWDLWPLGRLASLSTTRPRGQALALLIREKLPMLGLSALASAVALQAQASEHAMATLAELPLGARLGQAGLSIAWYVGRAFWPSGLTAFYPTDLAPGGTLAWASVAAVLAATALVVAARHPPTVVGWAWFLITLLPVIGLVQVGGQARADRYGYLPFIGLFLAVAWGVPRALDRLGLGSGARDRSHTVLAVAGAAGIAALTVVARLQVGYWRDGRALVQRMLDVDERNAFAHNSLGRMLSVEGRFAEAEAHLRRSIALAANDGNAWFNLGVVLTETGRWSEAVSSYSMALRLRPGWAAAHFNLGRALQGQGDLEAARAAYREALRIEPARGDAHNNLGILELALGNLAEAQQHLVEAERIDPASWYPHLNLVQLHLARGDVDRAAAELEAARRLGGRIPPQIEQEVARRSARPDPIR
jgi:tetratricopeptide (TPR) repeat protein